jgi:succinate dehydrogenase (ubiquinone) cytochrome b560 subunit
VATVKASHDQEQDILVQQRKNRPESPHLTIYKPQLTWVLSGLHRITGVFMAAGFYGLTCTYAATAILGLPFDINSLIASFGALPAIAKIGAKAAMSFPFAFHSFNGLRHLIWDFGKELTIQGVYRTGYVVLAIAGVVGSYLTFF